jgi:hypothetical protein
MAGSVVDFTQTIDEPHTLATQIARLWTEWNSLRQTWIEEKKELRNYLYATDTSTTGNAVLPWSNTTTTPKLTQIMDNLHANYFATLFPQSKWMKWEALDGESDTKRKKDFIQSYMETKLRQSQTVNVFSDLLYDWIQYGNCFAMTDFVRETNIRADGTVSNSYIGPRVLRISPFDIVFNPTASSFRKTPKIIKSILTLGEISRLVQQNPEEEAFASVFSQMLGNRRRVGDTDSSFNKADGFVADGFSDIKHYYGSNYVEVLTFYGDIYDVQSGKLLTDMIITVVDRAYIISSVENPGWSGTAPIHHVGWRDRPDNLYAMGPLDNLVGLQYRIDHLENLKADVFDQIAYPVLKIRGDVEDFDFSPGSRIYMGDEGDVGYLVPDATALQADFQIRTLEDKMEEMAGAPRQAMGIRTPGEKTAFEVQSLQNSAARIFEHKAAHFERVFLEPILNDMFSEALRNMDASEPIGILDPASGETVFKTIQKEDITGNGKIVPMGARHFAERARRVQNLNTLLQIKMMDPTIGVHLSGKGIAEILAEEIGEKKLFIENIQVTEQMETQMAAQDKEADAMEQMQIGAEMGV